MGNIKMSLFSNAGLLCRSSHYYVKSLHWT
jgi:hypothetical protein